MALSTADVEILDDARAYDGYYIIRRWKLRYRLFSGGWSNPVIREIFERGDASAIVLYDPRLRQTILVEQFRAGVLNSGQNPWLLELVAGIIEPGETPIRVACREAQEESNLIVTDVIPIFHYWASPGCSAERFHLFCGRVDATQAGDICGLANEDEDIRVHVIPVTTLYEALETGKIDNAMTIIGLQWLQLHEEKLRERWLA